MTTSKPFQGMILFADDVRKELGGRSSLMGISGTEISLNNQSKITLHCVAFFVPGCTGVIPVKGGIKVSGVPENFKQLPELDTTITIAEVDANAFVEIDACVMDIPVGDNEVIIQAAISVGDLGNLASNLRITQAKTALDEPAEAPKKKRRTARKAAATS